MVSSAAFARLTRAFKSRNFTLFVWGNAFNLIGFWMQRIVVGWLAWEFTHSGAWLGIIAFADLAPTLVISPIAGAVVDREDRLSLAKLTQFLAMLQSLALAGLAWTGALTIWWLLILTVCNGVIFSFWQPTRLALIPSLVAPADLSSAVALNSVIFNVARFIGPAIAGFLLIHGGPVLAFAGNSLTFIAILISLGWIRLPSQERGQRRDSRILADIAAGYRYAARHPGIGPSLVLMSASCVFSRPVFELLPGFAAEVFGRGAAGLSALASVTGIGAIGAGLWLGSRASITGLTRIMVGNVLLLAVCLLAFVATHNFWFGLASLGVAGVALVISGAGGQTLVQGAVDKAMRGRVMALYGMILRSGPALGALSMGMASDVVGLRLPVALGGVLTLAVWWWTVKRLRTMTSALEEQPTAAHH